MGSQVLRIDFHVHTATSPDSRISVEDLLSAVPASGLDGVAVCDHDRIGLARELASRAPFRVIVGEEVRTTEGELIGYFMDEEVPGGLPPEETIERIRAQGGIVAVPHPFDRYRSSRLWTETLDRIADDLDAVEGLNARNLRAGDDEAAQEWARERGLALVAGSDAHSPGEVGRCWVELPEFEDAQGLLASLGEGVLGGRRSGPLVHVPTVARKRLGRRRRVEDGHDDQV